MPERDLFMDVPDNTSLVGAVVEALSDISLDDHEAQDRVKADFSQFLSAFKPYGLGVDHKAVAHIAFARACEIREISAIFSQTVSSERFND